MSPFLVLPRALTKPLRWPADSVRRARHNAYAANAVLAVRRAEREEVARFLDEHRPDVHDLGLHRPASREVEEPVAVPERRGAGDGALRR
ncbi:hypothetical protein P5P86_07190 [Nocardioides sp. BP30]|uniref:hypothetical protein n=1 Tax=Nocardioides sp. BP30 TaxID=3036374 RepID=UPI002468FE95|nr:hypothetical protein [Nocardioides sp. BP30]WGL53609.1 hypothetical protein P5P86_07190 [Nocardioides sp. BP30]